MLIIKLRGATAAMHQELDALLVPVIQEIQSKKEYAGLLSAFYGFFKPVYRNIDSYLDINLLPDYSTRRKPEIILSDLKALSIDQPIQLCNDLPVIQDNASAFGALYVLEGSTLGGLLIRKMIAERLGISTGLSFFSGYDKQTKERWNIFIQALNDLGDGDDVAAAVIQTASATFLSFKQWLQQQLNR